MANTIDGVENRQGRLPNAFMLGVRRGLLEIKVFSRNRSALVFNIAMPMALMLLFGNLFNGFVEGTNVPIHDLIVAGVVASSIMSSAFGSMAYGISLDLYDGTLRRLWSTPFPLSSYFVSKMVLILALAISQVFAILVIARVAFDFSIIMESKRWMIFLFVFVLGIVSTSLLGLLIGAAIEDARNTGGMIQFPFVILQFISGTYYSFTALPPILQSIGAIFPLKWITQGIQGALLPEAMVIATPKQSWEYPLIISVLSIWAIASAVVGISILRRRLIGQFS